MILKDFKSDLDKCGVQVDEEMLSQIQKYLDLIFKWGQKINLTSVSTPEELFRFHFLEAFWAAEFYLGELDRFVDIGTGAGFPGLAIKIYRPMCRVSLIEPNLKRVMFLLTVSSILGLDVEVFHGRAEDFPSWNQFRTATVRALKPSSELLNLLRHPEFSLLVFRGASNPVKNPEWVISREARFPLSRNRWVSQFVKSAG